MKAFYLIENGQVQVGQGVIVPEGFTVYTVGKEPQELLEAMVIQEAKEVLQNKIAEANQYLKDTDWVEAYKLRNDLNLEIIPETSSKWEILAKREEYKVFLKTN